MIAFMHMLRVSVTKILVKKVAFREVSGDIQFRLNVKALSLPNQVDAIFSVKGCAVKLLLPISEKLQYELNFVISPSSNVSIPYCQKVARFEINTDNGDEFVLIAMNANCFKRVAAIIE